MALISDILKKLKVIQTWRHDHDVCSLGEILRASDLQRVDVASHSAPTCQSSRITLPLIMVGLFECHVLWMVLCSVFFVCFQLHDSSCRSFTDVLRGRKTAQDRFYVIHAVIKVFFFASANINRLSHHWYTDEQQGCGCIQTSRGLLRLTEPHVCKSLAGLVRSRDCGCSCWGKLQGT